MARTFLWTTAESSNWPSGCHSCHTTHSPILLALSNALTLYIEHWSFFTIIYNTLHDLVYVAVLILCHPTLYPVTVLQPHCLFTFLKWTEFGFASDINSAALPGMLPQLSWGLHSFLLFRPQLESHPHREVDRILSKGSLCVSFISTLTLHPISLSS